MLELAYASLARNLAKLRRNEPRAWEGLHPEGVHQMRVAIRRLRAALKTFRNFLPAERSRNLNAELRWLASVLGEVRDSDVYSENFEKYLAGLAETDAQALANYRNHLAGISRQARAQLHDALAGERYRALLQSLDDFLNPGPSPGRRRRLEGVTIGYGAAAIVHKPLDKMLRAGSRIDTDSPDERLHELRILGKRVRYQSEFFADFYPKQLARFLKACRQLQDVLGEHQDAAVACERLRHYSESVPTGDAMRHELLALGRLVQIQARHGAEQRERFAKDWRRFTRAAGKLRF